MLLNVMAACRARRSHSSSQNIDRSTIAVSPARRTRTAWQIRRPASITALLLRSTVKTPVFSAIVQGLNFFYYYCDLTCCASGDDVRVAHSCTPIGKAPWAQLSATQRIRVRKCLSQKEFWTTRRPVPAQATGSWVLRRRRTLMIYCQTLEALLRHLGEGLA